MCEENYAPVLPNKATCQLVPEGSKISNCVFYSLETVSQVDTYGCSYCKEGYVKAKYANNSLTPCVQSRFKGCKDENEASTACDECNASYGWWAVDFSNEKGQICENELAQILGSGSSSASIASVILIIAFVLVV